MVKLFGWEEKMSERIDQKRREELNAIRKLKMYNLLNSIFKFVSAVSFSILVVLTSTRSSTFIPIVTMVVTFAIYVSI